MKTNLEFVPTGDLIRELLRRCDHGVVAVMRCGDTGLGRQSIERLWKGNAHTAAGLCLDLQQTILLHSKADEVEIPGDLSGGA